MTIQHNKSKRWQFSLKSLFVVTTGASVLLAFWGMLLIITVFGVFVFVGVAISLTLDVGHLWYVFAIGAAAGVVVTRLIVIIGRRLDSDEPDQSDRWVWGVVALVAIAICAARAFYYAAVFFD